MREEIQQLVQLQELDLTIRKLQTEMQEFARKAAEAERAAAAGEQKLADSTEEAKTFRRTIDKREGDLKEIEAKVKKLETQLNMASSNKEYAAFQHEILGLKADKSKAEDEILKMFDQVERQQAAVKELASGADAGRKEARARKQAVETAIADAEARIERLKEERKELAAKISPSFLTPYQRLLTRAGGRAMAACRNYVCDACKMSLTANTVNLLMIGDKLTMCHSCGRILYLAEGTDLTDVATAGRKEF